MESPEDARHEVLTPPIEVSSNVAEAKQSEEYKAKELNVTLQASNAIGSNNIIELNVGGLHYTASLSTLRRDPNSMLALMFREGQMPSGVDRNGSIFIDRDGGLFRHVLAYLRDGRPPKGVDRETRLALQAEAAFYQVEGLQAWAEVADAELSPWETSANTVKQAVDAASQDLERFARSLAQGWFRRVHDGLAYAPPTQGVQSLFTCGTKFGVWVLATPMRFVLLLVALLALPICLTVMARRSFWEPVVSRHWLRLNVGGRFFETTSDVVCGEGLDPRKYTTVLRRAVPAGIAAHYAWSRVSGRLYCAVEAQRHRAMPHELAAARCGSALRTHSQINDTALVATNGTLEILLTNQRLHRLVSDCLCKLMFQIRIHQEGTFLPSGTSLKFDRDPMHFRHILNFLRDGALPQGLSLSARAEMCREANYYVVPGLIAWCGIATQPIANGSLGEVLFDTELPQMHPMRTLVEAAQSIAKELDKVDSLSPVQEVMSATTAGWLAEDGDQTEETDDL